MKNKAHLSTQLFLTYAGVLLMLILVIGISQNIVTNHYVTKYKISTMETRYNNFIYTELKETKTVKERSVSTDNDKNKYLYSEDNELPEIGNSSYAISRLVDKNIGAVYVNNSGKVIGAAAFNPSNSKLVYGKTFVPVFSENEYKRLIAEDDPNSREFTVFKRKDSSGNCYLTIWKVLTVENKTIALIQLSTPIESIESMLNDQTMVFALVSFFILIFGVILIRIIVFYSLKPMKDMSELIAKISFSNLYTRLDEEKGQVEINKLAHSFNEMLKRLENAFQQELDTNEKMRRFVSDASHELKTPLTSIHGFVEVLLRGKVREEEQLEKALNSILMESERLGGLVNDLLALTKLERETTYQRKNSDLSKLINEIEPQLRVLTGLKKLQLEFEEDESFVAYINEDHIKQVVYNLVQNGVQHTDPKKREIKIRLKNIDQWVILEIEDNGMGISQDDITHIFDRFYRVGGHRSRKQGGSGLGLSIVKSIVDSHGGKIRVESKVGERTNFKVFFPK